MFSDKISQQLLVNTGLVDDLGKRLVPAVSTLNRPALQFTAVSQKVHPSSIAFSSTGSASSRPRFDPRPKLKPIAPKPGDGTWISPKGIVLAILQFGNAVDVQRWVEGLDLSKYISSGGSTLGTSKVELFLKSVKSVKCFSISWLFWRQLLQKFSRVNLAQWKGMLCKPILLVSAKGLEIQNHLHDCNIRL